MNSNTVTPTPEPREQKLSAFRPKIRFQLDAGPFIIKTVETAEELYNVLRLRYECFIREWKLGSDPNGIDHDAYDAGADHVQVLDRASNRVVATYRLLCSDFVSQFYSQNEFELTTFLASPGIKLELGRACVHPEFRDGSAIGLVWRGVTHYIQKVRADYLFGCSSVHTTSAEAAMGIFHSLRPRYYSDQFGISPTQAYRFEWNHLPDISGQSENFSKLIPGLLQSYLLAGAKVHGLPALDRDFHCTDFMTILSMNELHPRMRRRYFDTPKSELS